MLVRYMLCATIYVSTLYVRTLYIFSRKLTLCICLIIMFNYYDLVSTQEIPNGMHITSLSSSNISLYTSIIKDFSSPRVLRFTDESYLRLLIMSYDILQ